LEVADAPNDDYMLTTIDNPYDPFTSYEEWHAWDESHGYNSASLLARVAKSSPDLSPSDQEVAIKQAIDDICQLNVSGMFTRAFRSVKQ
jgi:hypothetical protein